MLFGCCLLDFVFGELKLDDILDENICWVL